MSWIRDESMTSNLEYESGIYVKKEISENVTIKTDLEDDVKGGLDLYVIKTELHDDFIVERSRAKEEEPESGARDDNSSLAGASIEAEIGNAVPDGTTSSTEPDDAAFYDKAPKAKGARKKSRFKLGSPKKRFTCNKCSYSSNFRQNVKSHILTHLDEKPFGCEICAYRCTSEGYLKQHMLRHTGEKPHACSLCDFRARHKKSLKEHMMKHSALKPFACDFCEYSSVTKGNLKAHMMQHTGEQPYACELCDHRARCRSNLKKHMMTHTDEKPFSCEFCDYKSRLKSGLASHMERHTNEMAHPCTICEYRSRSKANLKIHMLKHSDVEPYECGLLCGYKTKVERLLKKHMLAHSSEKPFACDMCAYRGKAKAHLKNHKSRVHVEHLVNSASDINFRGSSSQPGQVDLENSSRSKQTSKIYVRI